MATPAGKVKSKPPCKYGKNCYRQNADHLQNFSHPDRDDDDNDEKSTIRGGKGPGAKPQTYQKRSIESFFTKVKEGHAISDSDSDENSNGATKKRMRKELSTSETKTSERNEDAGRKEMSSSDDNVVDNPSVSNAEEEDNEDKVGSTPPPSPTDRSERFSSKFLVKMPEDFFQFWQFCISEKNFNPQNIMANVLKLKIVGPFDILLGRHRNVTKNKYGRRPNYLLHFRYFYDPPEFQTVLAATDKSNFHIGYFRDDPQEDPVFVASNNPDALSGKEKITAMGDNLFAAVHIHASKLVKSASGSEKKKIEDFMEKLKGFALVHGFDLAPSTKRMKERQKKVVCPTFHAAGMVVPVDENEIGYRPVPETPAHLRTMLKGIADGKSKQERDTNFEELEELITLVQFANDECDFGEGLELGLDLFSFGRKCFHPQIEVLMPLAYQFLKRNAFCEIIKAHLKNRRNLHESVDELEV